jgi:hypothetical protein
MNNDVMMINKKHETLQFTQLNNNIKDSKTFFTYLVGCKLHINSFNGIIM